MLETAANVNRIFVTMTKIITQIYEVQNPEEAQRLIDIGVDHIGSVVLSEDAWKIPGVKATIDLVRTSTAKSSLIPLYNSLESVLRTLDYYQPDIVHFCEALADQMDVWNYCDRLCRLQDEVKIRFPRMRIMRSIPIAPSGRSHLVPTLKLAAVFEPVSDYFLTDTLLVGHPDTEPDSQPVHGFVGITGQTCCWRTAADLVEASSLPVILAGGISPDNVAAGILKTGPAGIDSCTQTNALDEKGAPLRFQKDFQKVTQLIEAVREAEKDTGG